MRIDHVALWVRDLEKSREFYCHYFSGKSNDLYDNPKKEFQSYFVTFDSGARLELMHSRKIKESSDNAFNPCFGLAHFAIAVGSKEEVDRITYLMKNDGCKLISGPRMTGDGYYESCIEDPDGNTLEIVS